jgi:hypothetical protein
MAETLLDPQPAFQGEQAPEVLLARLKTIVGRMESEANRRVGLRTHLEKRWIEDLQQYHGRYDDKTEKALNKGDRSKLFINLTRTKTNAMSARLMDLLFPTDDKNWGISPTPVPELTEAASQAAKAARQMRQHALQAQEAAASEGADPATIAQAQQTEAQAKEAEQKAAELDAKVAEGRRRADLMSAEIDDQLKESQYHAAMRDVIEDACKLGTGVCKGPVTGDKVRQGWKKRLAGAGEAEGQGETSEYELKISTGTTPAMRKVDIWSFFPDLDASKIEEGEGVYERHLLNQKRLRGLAKLPGFDKDAIRRLLASKPRGSAPSYLADLRNLSRDNNQITGDLYHVWEYTGPLSAEDMQDLALAMGDKGTSAELEEVDPLTELNAVVWFCQDEILKFAVYPYDSGECMYSVFNLEKDEASIFGYGIPAIMRDPQKSLNASWRAMMDNAGLSTGPQIAIAQQYLEPADGKWEIAPRKVWLIKEAIPKDTKAFDAFNIPSNQAEYANIIAISKQFVDDMTAMPSIAQGDQGVNPVKTFGGQALQMNSASVVFRRIVKNFDDDVTTPNIRRFFDWNMQFSPKAEIKGDFEVEARGSSVLLVRELQSQSLMFIAMNLGAHPVFGPMLKNRAVLRKLFETMMIPANEVVLSDEEIDAILAQAEAQNSEAQMAQLQQDAAAAELEAKINIANLDAQTRVAVAKLNRETALIEYATRANVELEKLEAMLNDKAEERASKERMMAAEAVMTAEVGSGGGGHF